MLNIEHISFRTHGLTILNDVTLSLKSGEITSLYGASGSGKTTLLQIIIGLLRPQSGKIIFKSKNLLLLPPHKIARFGVAWAPQNQRIFSGLSVLEHLSMIKKTPSALRGFLDCFPILKEKYTEKADILSGGQKTLLTLARALSLDPEILLLDELTQGLHHSFLAPLFQYLREYNRDRKNIILLTTQNPKGERIKGVRHVTLEHGQIV